MLHWKKSGIRILTSLLAICFLASFAPQPLYAVAEEPLLLNYNFLKLCLRRENSANGGYNGEEARSYANKGLDVTKITDFAMTTMGLDNDQEVNKNANLYGSPTGATDPWHYVGAGGASFKFVSYDYAMQMSGSIGGWVAIKIKVPKDGIYRAISVNGYWTHSPIVRIYLAPEDAEDPRAAQYALNSEDCYAPQGEDKWNLQVPLNTVELEAGNYIVSYEILGKNPEAKDIKFCVQAFRLQETTEKPTLTINAAATEVGTGQSAKAALEAQWSDGTAWDLYGTTVTAMPRDASIADVMVIDDENHREKYLQITGKKNGNTVLDMTVSKGGTLLGACEVPITVSGDAPAEPLLLNYNFLKLCLRREHSVNGGYNGEEARSYVNKGLDVTKITDFAMTTMDPDNDQEVNKNANLYGSPTGATDPWHYVGVGNGGKFNFVSYDYAMQVSGSVGGWAAIKIKVPKDGIYKAVSVHGYWTHSPVMRFYLAPEDAKNPRAEEYVLNAEETYVPKGREKFNQAVPLSTVKLQAGNYIVSYEIAGQNPEAADTKFCVQAFRLQETGNLSSFESFTADRVPTLPVGGQTKVSLTVRMNDGSINILKDMTVEAVPQDPSIVSAEVLDNAFQLGKHLKIQALSPGETAIVVKLLQNGESVITCEVPVTVSDGESPVRGLRLELTKNTVAVGKFTTTAVTAELEDGLIRDMDPQQIAFTTSDPQIASVDDKGTVTAHKEGTTQITAAFSQEEQTITAEATLTVVERKLIYNFLKLDLRRATAVDRPALNNQGVSVGTVLSMEQTTEGSSQEINPQSQYMTEPWCYLGVNNATFAFVSSEYAIQLGCTSDTGWASVKIRVPYDGLYQTISEQGYWHYSPIVRYYLAPEDAENPRAPEYSIGIDDTYVSASSQKFQVLCPLNVVELKAGDYILSYEIVGKNPDAMGARFCVTSFRLEPVEKTPSYSLQAQGPKPFNPGVPVNVCISALGDNGATDALFQAEVSVESLDPAIATASVSEPDRKALGRAVTITGQAPGTTQIRVRVRRGEQELEPILIPVTVKTPVLDSIKAEMERTHLNLNRNPVPIHIRAWDPDGDPVHIPPEACTFTLSDPVVASVSAGGMVTPLAEGRTDIQVRVALGGETLSDTLSITVGASKTQPTFYTQNKREAALENASKYSWGRELRDSTRKIADQYVEQAEKLWQMVPAEGLPRSIFIGLENDPDGYTCRYCNKDLRALYGAYSWITDPMDVPWKIRCPDCRRLFPSNNFDKFYQLGLNQHGIFDYELAHARNAELVAGGEDGYLKNILYPEMDKKLGVTGWGVDDGFGYKTGKIYDNGVQEVHTYIAYYIHYGLWRVDSRGKGGVLVEAVTSLRDAYLYTGEAQYGRTGAILLDRIADLYPDFHLMQYFKVYSNSHGGTGEGKIIGREWEAMTTAPDFALAYDAFYPVMADEQVVRFLSGKAQDYQLANDKSTPELIRRNSEDGILREIFRAVKTADIHGNFGVHQRTLALAAVVLDSMPETREMIDWIMQTGTKSQGKNTGGDMMRTFVDLVDRDGFGNESAPNYNRIWMNNSIQVAEALADYKSYDAANLYANPKFYKMLTAFAPLTLIGQGVPAIGDSGKSGGKYFQQMELTDLLTLYSRTGDQDFARLAWHLNGNRSHGIRGDIFTKDPEALAGRIQKEVEAHGEWDYGKSDLLAGYGFAALRDGKAYSNAGGGIWDVQRDFWMYFGGANTSHKHLDALNLGIDAYGVNVAPDLGYPEATGSNPNRYQWVSTTLSHNTVMVNETEQNRIAEAGFTQHYDSAERVKLIDVDAPQTYDACEKYRRTVVMIDVDGEASYGVDFFRVRGGNDHLYSFHAMSNEVVEYTGFTPETQTGGSYAGPEVPWGEDPWTVSTSITAPLKYPKGYTWLKNVRRADTPGTGAFSVDFKIMDHNQSFPRPMDLHLRMTALNSFPLQEITLADGVPPRVTGNPESLTYVLARRKGADLDSLFTTVYEPYCGERYIRSMECVEMQAVEGSLDEAKAIRIEHTNGRIDYVLYSEDPYGLYKITDGDTEFYFRGFLGVYTLRDGEVVYRYLNDGDILGGKDAFTRPEITGTVLDFSKELTFDSRITAELAGDVQAQELVGRYVYVENDGVQNAVYPIAGVEPGDGGSWILHLGNQSLIRSLKDANAINGGYVYNIQAGEKLRIPLSKEEKSGLELTSTASIRVAAGRTMSYAIPAKSNGDQPIAYTAAYLPRGAALHGDGTLEWTPDSAQIGEHLLAVRVDDGTLPVTLYLQVEVVKASGDRAPSPGPGKDGPGADQTGQGQKDQTDGEEPKPPEKAPHFKDLDGYDWAKDAIESLAERGIVKGTGPQTYSPGKSMTRADFAILLTRAFGFTAEADTRPFDDVPADAYYAQELLAARSAGIVDGVGNNRFEPDRPIRREDMMVIVHRALIKTGRELTLPTADALSAFTDSGELAGYAREAAAVLTANQILAGDRGRLNPKGLTTRAEIAVLLYRILDTGTHAGNQ